MRRPLGPWVARGVALLLCLGAGQVQGAPPARIVGAVTCGGQPVWAALVQALADEHAKAPLGEAYTDEKGQFVLAPQAGATVVRVRRGLRSAEGSLLAMASPALPADSAARTYALTLREVHAQWVAATPEDLTACTDAGPPPNLALLQEQARSLLDRAGPQPNPAAARLASFCGFDHCEAVGRVLERYFKAAEGARDVAQLAWVAARTAEVGQSAADFGLQAIATTWQGVAELYAGAPQRALPWLRAALELQAKAVAALQGAPGWAQSARAIQAVLFNINANLSAASGAAQLASQQWQSAAELYEAVDKPSDAAEAHLNLADQASQAHQPELALRHALDTLRLIEGLAEPALRGRALLVAAQNGAESDRKGRMDGAAQVLADAPQTLAVLTARLRVGQYYAKQKAFAQALRHLGDAIGGLERLPASEARQNRLWEALGGLGRGQLLYDMGKHALAVADLQRATDLQPRQLGPRGRFLDWQLLGYCLGELGRQAEARQALQRACTLLEQDGATADPADPAAPRKSLELLLSLRDAEAWTYLEQEPPLPAAALALLDKTLERAVKLGMAAAEAHLADTAAYACMFAEDNKLEYLQRGEGYLKRAQRVYVQLSDPASAARIQGQLAHLTRLRAEALLSDGQKEQAERALRSAVTLYDHQGEVAASQSAQDALAMLLYEQSRWTEAAQLWEGHAQWLQTPAAARASQETLTALQHVSEATRANLDPRRQRAATLGLLASCWANTAQPARSLAALRLQAEQWREVGDIDKRAGTLRELAVQALQQGARDQYSAALAEAEPLLQSGDAKAALGVLRLLGALQGADLRAAQAAVDQFDKALRDAKEDVDALPADQREGFVQAWGLVGVLRARLGEPVRGLAALEKAAKWAQPVTRAALLDQLARQYRVVGRLQDALDTQGKIMELRSELAMYNRPSFQLATLLEVWDVQRQLGDNAGAAKSLVAATELARQVAALPRQDADDRRILGDFMTLSGQQQLREGHWTKAAEALKLALQFYPPHYRDERTELAAVALPVAQVRAVLQADGRAELQSLSRRLRIALQSAGGTMALEAVALGADLLQDPAMGPRLMSETSPDQPDAKWLLELLQRAHARGLSAGRLGQLPELSRLQGQQQLAMGLREEAIATLRRAVDEHELVRSTLASDLNKAALGEQNDEQLYARLERLLADSGRVEEALEVSEQRRARALLDVLATGQVRSRLRTGQAGTALQAVAGRMQALSQQDELLDIDVGQGLQRIDPATGRTTVLGKTARKLGLQLASKGQSAEELMLELSETRRQLAGSSAEVVSLMTAPLVTAHELEEAARQRGVTLVEWSLHPKALYIYVIRPTGSVAVRKVGIGAEQVEALVKDARLALGAAVDRTSGRTAEVFGLPTAPPGVDAATALRALAQVLIRPIADALPTDSSVPVILSPQRALLLVPMAALPLADGEPWGAHSPLASVPSLGVLRYTAPKIAEAAKTGALVVGDPQMPFWQGTPLAQLPGAQREAASVAKALGAAGTVLLTGGTATETAVRFAMGGKRWIHLATHGLARDDDPGLSFVALTPDPKEDGLLTVGEVLQLHTHADLVVLSACQTGLGKVSGDGVLGLGRAFLYAGTPRVVVSLWSVPDEPTALLMASLYAELAKGRGPADSLRRAQTATRSQYPDPAQWAAFVLIGEPK